MVTGALLDPASLHGLDADDRAALRRTTAVATGSGLAQLVLVPVLLDRSILLPAVLGGVSAVLGHVAVVTALTSPSLVGQSARAEPEDRVRKLSP